MPDVTLSLDEETYDLIKSHPEVNWNYVARQAFCHKAREIHMREELLSGSKLTEQEAIEAGDDAKQAIVDRLGWRG